MPDSPILLLCADEAGVLAQYLSGFRPALKFDPALRGGWLFKLGDLGLGHYRDHEPNVFRSLVALAGTCRELHATMTPHYIKQWAVKAMSRMEHVTTPNTARASQIPLVRVDELSHIVSRIESVGLGAERLWPRQRRRWNQRGRSWSQCVGSSIHGW